MEQYVGKDLPIQQVVLRTVALDLEDAKEIRMEIFRLERGKERLTEVSVFPLIGRFDAPPPHILEIAPVGEEAEERLFGHQLLEMIDHPGDALRKVGHLVELIDRE